MANIQYEFLARLPTALKPTDEIFITGFATKDATSYKLTLGDATSGKFKHENFKFELTIDIEEKIATLSTSKADWSDIIYIDLRKEHVLQPGMYFDIKLIVSEPDQIVAYLNGLLIDTKPFRTTLEYFKHLKMSNGIARIETLGFVFLKMKNYDGRTILSPH